MTCKKEKYLPSSAKTLVSLYKSASSPRSQTETLQMEDEERVVEVHHSKVVVSFHG